MCGIVGVYKHDGIDEKLNREVGKAAKYIRHRGPDYTGVWSDRNISMAHNKLSILDFSDVSNQPVLFEDVVVAFNGEIYNYKYLINKYSLPNRGFDAHVIAELYQLMGIEFLREINGDFAIILYDKSLKRLYIYKGV